MLDEINNTDIIEENESTEGEESSEDSRIERYQINTFSQDRAIETLLKWYKNGKLILPEFQRDFVWSYANSSRLIESILLNLPIPNIFLFKTKDENGEKFLLIDGLQRITTINQYVDGHWEQGDKKRVFRLHSPNEKWNRKTFAKLDENDQQFIYDYPIGTTIFESSSGTELDQNNVIFSVFERINTGSEKLSDQEIRNAIYGGECLDTLKDVAPTPDYVALIEQDKAIMKRGKNIELLLRFITYKHIYDNTTNGITKLVESEENSNITTSKKIMLNNYMHYANKGLIDYNKDLENVLEAIHVISNFDTSAFCVKSKSSDAISDKVHELFAEALVLAVIKNDYKINISKEKFIQEKIALWNSETLVEPFKYKTTDYNTVATRVDFVEKLIRG